MSDQLTIFDLIKFNADGLVPAIVQDSENGQVLMMAWMDKPAVERTLSTGQTWFYSRSRKSSWHKGGTSGHVQQVESIRVDCDGDTLLIKVRQVGGACHNGYYSCFYRELDENGLWREVAMPVFQPESVYKK
jgi:phosphoribosyl-AMP cyclohydrolase